MSEAQKHRVFTLTQILCTNLNTLLTAAQSQLLTEAKATQEILELTDHFYKQVWDTLNDEDMS